MGKTLARSDCENGAKELGGCSRNNGPGQIAGVRWKRNAVCIWIYRPDIPGKRPKEEAKDGKQKSAI